MTSVFAVAPTSRRFGNRFVPVTIVMTVVPVIVTLLVEHLHRPTVVLRALSTNVDNLLHVPIRVFVGSAFVTDPGPGLAAVLALGAALWVLERRIGSLRTVAVFASGHVLATLLTEGGVWVGLHFGSLPADDRTQIDVGISYGLWASIAAATALVPRRYRPLLVPLAGFGTLLPLVSDVSMTSIGHVVSVLVGLAWWPYLLRHNRQDARAVSMVRASAAAVRAPSAASTIVDRRARANRARSSESVNESLAGSLSQDNTASAGPPK